MADTVNQFKHRLDKYWKNCDFVYDHRATYTLELEADSECNMPNTCMSRLRNDLYYVEWDVKLYYTIPYHTIPYHNIP